MKRATTITRRQVLRGSGGVALGLPFLPSLLPGPAYGADPVFASPKRMVCIGTPHGAVLQENRDPPPAQANNSMLLYPGHTIRYGRLAATTSGGKTSVSPVLTGPSTVFTPQLLGKMNVLRGFDIPWYIAHNTGGYLGNFWRSDAVVPQVNPMITIDQLLAWSNTFQPDLTGIRQRSVVTGFDFHGMSWGWSNPQAKTGTIDKVDVINSSLGLFDSLFGGATPAPAPKTPTAPARKPVVDSLVAAYNSLRQSNARLSADDKQRLDDHLARLAELQRSITTAATSMPLSCNATKPTQSSVLTDDAYVAQAECKRRYTLLNDVVAMGLACGATRLASIFTLYPYSDYRGDWHQDVAHQAAVPANQALLTDSNQAMFESIVLDLAGKLDAVQEAPGQTVLDSTLLFWGNESGTFTHVSQDMEVVTFGSAKGFFKTGYYVDYRNMAATARLDGGPQLGLGYRQWLANCLLAMGVPRQEFESGGITGYGDPYAEAAYAGLVDPKVISQASDPLPIVTG